MGTLLGSRQRHVLHLRGPPNQCEVHIDLAEIPNKKVASVNPITLFVRTSNRRASRHTNPASRSLIWRGNMHRIKPFGVYPAKLHLAGIPSKRARILGPYQDPLSPQTLTALPSLSNADEFSGDTGHLLDRSPQPRAPSCPSDTETPRRNRMPACATKTERRFSNALRVG